MSLLASPVTPDGLTAAEATTRLVRDGPNSLPPPPRTPAWRLLLAQLTHFFAGMLWVAALLAQVASMTSLALAIVAIVLLNGIFAFVQEHKADRAAARLGAMMPARTRVRRDGTTVTVQVTELVRGDVVLVEAGDRIGADLRILAAHELTVDESMLTGESAPLPRTRGGDLFAGTFAAQGEATAVVVATGSATRLAGIAALTSQAHRPPTPLAQQLHKLVLVVAAIAVSVGVLLGASALSLGLGVTGALLLGIGVMVALVPEGLLPTVTLSLARGAQEMARQHALVRRLDAVETLGATTFICTDKTGTLTRNQMAVVEGWTPAGPFRVDGTGYDPAGSVDASGPVLIVARTAARAARACTTGRAVERKGLWRAEGDPMDAALDVWASRLGLGSEPPPTLRLPFRSATRWSAGVLDGTAYVMGAPEELLRRCTGLPADDEAAATLHEMSMRGRRVLAVTRVRGDSTVQDETTLRAAAVGELELLALVGIEDPPRADVPDAVRRCRAAGIRLAVLTGDSVTTGAAIATEVGLLGPGGTVVAGADLPESDEELAALLDRDEGTVVARVTPEDKLRIARALRTRGHVVAMTGDGVNDAAALREADVGVAMGLSGSDVAREAADLVLLDDNFATIPKAIELGRGTFTNIRRFLTFHLTDNVAEVVPFAVWALTGSAIPLAIGVLQVLALDIGTDMLPALALGAEPPDERTMEGPRRTTEVVDASLLRRALLVLGPTEAMLSMGAFLTVLVIGGWSYGDVPTAGLMGLASGAAFAVIASAQIANAYACRSESRPAWRVDPRRNPLLFGALVVEVVLLLAFLGAPWLSELLGGAWPSSSGWMFCLLAIGVLPVVDAAHKAVGRRAPRRRSSTRRDFRL